MRQFSFSTGSGKAFPLEAGVRWHMGSCLHMCIGSCLHVQVSVKGALGYVCHIRKFTLGAHACSHHTHCLFCLMQHCVNSDTPTGSPSLAEGDAPAALPTHCQSDILLAKQGEESSPNFPLCPGMPAPFLLATGRASLKWQVCFGRWRDWLRGKKPWEG